MSEKYHFNEIADIEKSMTRLVGRLKTNIDRGKYGVIISDDVGGRIPTLAIRDIIKHRNPRNSLDTHFVAAGYSLLKLAKGTESYHIMREYLDSIRKDSPALVVTQLVSSGQTLTHLSNLLAEAGITNADFSAVDIEGGHAQRWLEQFMPFYFGSSRRKSPLSDGHEKFSGVRKSLKEYKPHPVSAMKLAPSVFDHNGNPLSFRETVLYAREDVKTLAETVRENVWGSKKTEKAA